MVKKFKHTFSVILVIILLLPMSIKLFDGHLHHHDDFHCTAKAEKHFHKHHEKCPIPNFELSLFSVAKQVQTIQKYNYFVEKSAIYEFVYYNNSLKYLFLLRAPPAFTDETITS